MTDNNKLKIAKEMETFWPIIIEKVKSIKETKGIKISMEWLEHLLQFNVPGGKKLRGMAFIMFYKSLIKNDEYFLNNNNNDIKCHHPNSNFPKTIVTDEQIFVTAWILEILQAACLIADDIMDNSKTRRGKPCWYLQDGVGIIAINDTLLLENVAFRLIDKYFKNSPYYRKVLKAIHRTSMKTLLGEYLDIKSQFNNCKQRNFNLFTTELYSQIVEFKTSYYTFCNPLILAMILAGRKDKNEFVSVKEVCLKIGHLFQAQDDYLDCFGNPEITGKIGTDIKDGKCTWLIVKALQKCTPEQKALLQSCYGKENVEDEKKVKDIFKDLMLTQDFEQYQDEMKQEISNLIDNLPDEIPKEQIHNILNSICRK